MAATVALRTSCGTTSWTPSASTATAYTYMLGMTYNGHHFRCMTELSQKKGNPRCHILMSPQSE